jgi:hypothetical protein
VKGIEELELDLRESMEASEEVLDRCCGTIMLLQSFERWRVEMVVVWEQER